MRNVTIAVILLLLAGCSRMQAREFDSSQPVFDPVAFLTGPTRSWGVFENSNGEPTRRFRTAMLGVHDGDALVVTQDFTFDDGSTKRRVWRLKRIDAHRFDATANDVIGVATGYAYGNAFRWEYTLQVKPGNPLTRVHMKHWMYLTDGGETLVNRVIISKLGVVVSGTTEYFHRGSGDTPAVGPGR